MVKNTTMLIDWHAHNGYYRGSGEVWSAEQGWNLARARGIDILGIMNKVEFNHPNHDWIPIMNQKLLDYGNAQVILGIELDIGHPSGKSVLDLAYLPYIDFIVMGPHNQPVKTLLWPDIDEEDLEEYFSSYGQMLTNSFSNSEVPVDIWAHPFLQEIENTGMQYWDYLEPILDQMLEICNRRNISLEINENFFRNPIMPKDNPWWKENSVYIKEREELLDLIFQKAMEYSKITFTFGSDSHHLEAVGNLQNCQQFAKKMGITQERMREKPESKRY